MARVLICGLAIAAASLPASEVLATPSIVERERELIDRGEFVAVSELWRGVGRSDEALAERLEAYVHSYLARVRAYRADGDLQHLCVAAEILGELEDLAEAYGPEAEIFREEAEELRRDIENELDAAEQPIFCDGDRDPSPAAELTPAPEAAAGSEQGAHGGHLAVAVAVAIDGDDDGDVDLGKNEEKIRRLRIAGGITSGFAAAFLGAMSVGLVIDARSAAAIWDFNAQEMAGVRLSARDWAEIRAHAGAGRQGSQIAVLTGIGGGALAITSAALFLRARRLQRRSPSFALFPAIRPDGASLAMKGRF